MPVYSRKQLSGAEAGIGIGQSSATSAANADIIHQVQATSTNAIEAVWLNLRSGSPNDAAAIVVLDTATATGAGMSVFLGDRGGSTNVVNLFKGLPLTGTDTILRAYWATDVFKLKFEGYYNLIATG